MNELETENPTLEKDNTWAWGISISIILFICLIILTVKIATVDYPVEMDNYYSDDYQFVDANINQMLKMSEEFDSLGYQLEFPKKIQLGENQWIFTLKDKNGNSVSNAEIHFLVSREATTTEDMNLGQLNFKEGNFHSESVNIPNLGFWQLILHINIGDLKVTRKTLLEIPTKSASSKKDNPAVNARSRIALIESQ